MKTKLFLLLFINTFLFFTACKKNEVNTDTEPSSPPDVTAPSYVFSRFDANGLFKVKRNFAYWNDPKNGQIETISKEATASFKLSPFDAIYTEMGVVFCQFRTLTMQSNGTYVINGNAGSSIGFNDTMGVFWSYSGNTAQGITAFSYTTTKKMPEYKGVASNSIPSNIARSQGFQLPLGANLVEADSVFVSLTVGSKSVFKTVNGLSSKCTFSNTELSSLPASAGVSALLQVSPINFDVALSGNKKIYFANQSSYTKFVEVK